LYDLDKKTQEVLSVSFVNNFKNTFFIVNFSSKIKNYRDFADGVGRSFGWVTALESVVLRFILNLKAIIAYENYNSESAQ